MTTATVEVLPEECLSHVISLTSPRDACGAAAVSGMFRSASDSDLAWDNFLPSDYREIISSAVSPVAFSSKKELFTTLSSSPLLVDGGNKTFSLDKLTSKKCYMLGARELSITWSTNPLCWCWKPNPSSRFRDSAEVIMLCRLEIQGRVNTQMLTPNTSYGAYLVFQISGRAFGLSALPAEVSIEVGGCKTSGRFYMNQEDSKRQEMEMEMETETETSGERAICARGDGWLEVELGEFYTGGGAKDVVMEFKEVKSEQLKGGLVVEGIELRPKH